MNCFVIMPYDEGFDDVYVAIKSAVEQVGEDHSINCYRLDEKNPAGRITERLRSELQHSTICIADITGSKPNVMWEIGYAMALSKPLLFVTQKLDEMPFDLLDMVSIEYDRNHLTQTLGNKLKRSVRDTIECVQARTKAEESLHEDSDGEAENALKTEISELKDMVGQLVKEWNPAPIQAVRLDSPEATTDIQEATSIFEGAWFNPESQSFMYAKMVNSKLVMPYCYGGNDSLTAVYYDFSKTGEFWFARFSWVKSEVSGFAFIKQVSRDFFSGAWWMDEDGVEISDFPPEQSGVPTKLERLDNNTPIPTWAEQFFEEAEKKDVHLILQSSLSAS